MKATAVARSLSRRSQSRPRRPRHRGYFLLAPQSPPRPHRHQRRLHIGTGLPLAPNPQQEVDGDPIELLRALQHRNVAGVGK